MRDDIPAGANADRMKADNQRGETGQTAHDDHPAPRPESRKEQGGDPKKKRHDALIIGNGYEILQIFMVPKEQTEFGRERQQGKSEQRQNEPAGTKC